MLRTVLIIGAAAIVVAACTASSGSGSSDAAQPSPASAAPSGAEAALPASIIDPIVADAATRLGVDPSAVTVVSAEEKSFSDGSLGCPEPGMMYTQALVDGHQVVVEANGTQLDYRGSGPDDFRLCKNP